MPPKVIEFSVILFLENEKVMGYKCLLNHLDKYS
jgi:hypothetical protein